MAGGPGYRTPIGEGGHGARRIVGPPASAKGLRHGFAIAALDKNVPFNIVSRWLGHSNLQTTTIYANYTGREERGLAARMW